MNEIGRKVVLDQVQLDISNLLGILYNVYPNTKLEEVLANYATNTMSSNKDSLNGLGD